jgi:protein-ribulosamine 3-kinase
MMMEGTFESENAFYSFAPKNVPKPIGWGTYKSDPNSHFYICDFQDMIEDLPDIHKFPALMARIHLDSMGKSPTGKFGFHVTTHLANIPNDNSWCDTWEEWYSTAMQ